MGKSQLYDEILSIKSNPTITSGGVSFGSIGSAGNNEEDNSDEEGDTSAAGDAAGPDIPYGVLNPAAPIATKKKNLFSNNPDSSPKKNIFSNIPESERAKKEKADPQDKAFDFWLPPEKQQEIEKKESWHIPDIMDVVNLFSKPRELVEGAVYQAAKAYKTGVESTDLYKYGRELGSKNASITQTATTMIDDAVKYWKEPDKHDYRDIMRILHPEELSKLEEYTSAKRVFSDDNPIENIVNNPIVRAISPAANMMATQMNLAKRLDLDAFSPIGLVGDTLLDPTTYIPFGAPMKLMGKMFSRSASFLEKGAVKVLGEEAVSNIVKAATSVYINKIAPITNIKAVMNNFGLGDAYKTYIEGVEAAPTKAQRVGKEASKIGGTDDSVLGIGMQKYLDEKKSVSLYQNLSKAHDDSVKALGDAYAKDMGVSVEGLAKSKKLVDILKNAGAVSQEADVNKDALLKDLTKQLEEAKIDVATLPKIVLSKTRNDEIKIFSDDLLQGKGVRRFTNHLAKTEFDATAEYARSELSMHRDIRSQAMEAVNKKITGTQKAMRMSNKAIGEMVLSDTRDIGSGIKEMDKMLSSETGMASSDEFLASLKEKMNILVKRVKTLGDYNIAETAAVKQASSAGVPYRNIINHILDLQGSIQQAEIGTAQEMTKMGLGEMRGRLKLISNEVKSYGQIRSSEFLKMGSVIKEGTGLTDEMIQKYSGDLKDLYKSRSNIESDFLKQKIKAGLTMKNAVGEFQRSKSAYFKLFRGLAREQKSQFFLKKSAAIKEAIWNKAKSEAPEELREPMQIIRDHYDMMRDRMMDSEEPLLKGAGPLYHSRQIDESAREKLRGYFSSKESASKGFLKKRSFELDSDYKKYLVEETGGKPIEDAVYNVMKYTQDAELAYAKHTFKQTILKKLGLATMKDLQRSKEYAVLARNLDYVFMEGKTSYSNIVNSGIFKSWGRLLNTAKFMLTIPSIAFEGRNMGGFPSFVARSAGLKYGLNPTTFIEAMMLKSGVKGELVGGLNGAEKISMDAFKRAGEDTGYYASSQLRGDFQESFKSVMNRYKSYDPRWWISKGLHAGQHIEDTGRWAAAIAAYKSGAPVEKALQIGKDTFFDYNLINSPMDKVLQGLFGFWTFSRKNLPQTIKHMMTDPKYFALQSQILGKISRREELSKEDLENFNDYDKTSYKMIGDAVHGQREFTSLGMFPEEEAYGTASLVLGPDSIIEKAQNILGSRMNPVMGLALDMFYGNDRRTGEDLPYQLPEKYTRMISKSDAKKLGFTLREKTKFNMGEEVGKKLIYFGNPRIIDLIKRNPWGGRQIGEFASFIDHVVKGEGETGVLEFFSGMKTKEFDSELGKFMNEMKIKAAKTEAAKQVGAPEFKQIYIPSELNPNSRKNKKKSKSLF